MKIQFSDFSYKRGFIENPILSYETRVNPEKQGIKDPNKGRWELESITYHFVRRLVEKGEVVIQGKVEVDITDETRNAVQKAKSADEVRIKKERRHKAKGYSETSLEERMSNGFDIPYNNKSISYEEHIDLKNAMEKLSKNHLEIIYLRYIKDMTLEEIGELKGVGKSAVLKMEQRALEVLRKHC